MEVFAARLKELRTNKGLSHIALGKAIGVNGSAISFWENNINTITAENIIALAKFFGVSTDYLLGVKDY